MAKIKIKNFNKTQNPNKRDKELWAKARCGNIYNSKLYGKRKRVGNDEEKKVEEFQKKM